MYQSFRHKTYTGHRSRSISYARRRSKKSKPKRNMNVHYYAALLPRRGPHIASHSVRLSVRLSVRPVIVAIGYVFSAPLASRRAT